MCPACTPYSAWPAGCRSPTTASTCFVVTVGLLIHIPDDALVQVMGELIRVSRRWVLSGEYHADEPTEIVYRGQEGVLFKRDYAALYEEHFPTVSVVESGFLTTTTDSTASPTRSSAPDRPSASIEPGSISTRTR